MLEKSFPVGFGELGPFFVPGFPFLVTVRDARVGGDNNGAPPFFGMVEQGVQGSTMLARVGADSCHEAQRARSFRSLTHPDHPTDDGRYQIDKAGSNSRRQRSCT